MNWLSQPDRQERAVRYPTPGVVAHYWDGDAPKSHPVKEMSLAGAYLLTTEKWWTGTIMTISLKHAAEGAGPAPAASVVSLSCKVVRHGPDGMGIAFMPHTKEEREALRRLIRSAVAKPAPPVHRKNGASERGQALIEYAFMVPFLFLLMVNCLNFGVFIYDWIEVANAARAGAQYAILGAASAGGLTAATGTQISTIVTNDMASVSGSPTVDVCKNNNGTLTTLAGTCSLTGSLAVPADPEAPFYVVATVDVTYTYKPITGDLKFPKLNLYATIPTTSIHRRAVMRVIQ